MRLLRTRVVSAALVFCAAAAVPCWSIANPESARLRARAYELGLNLDYDEATREMEAATVHRLRSPAATEDQHDCLSRIYRVVRLAGGVVQLRL